jgi:large subunit ribosomal protein L30
MRPRPTWLERDVMLKITQVKSSINRKQGHKGTLRALGITRLNQTVYQDDNPVIRGMVKKIEYMLAVSEVDSKDEG